MYSSEYIFNIPLINEIILEYKKQLECMRVIGSTGNIYWIKYISKDTYTCTCPAFKYYSGNCKHIKAYLKSSP